MTDFFLTLLKTVLMVLPMVFFILRNAKANLKKTVRCYQFLMPAFALLYCILALIFLSKINDLLLGTVLAIPGLIGKLWQSAGEAVGKFIRSIDLPYWLFFISNTALLLLHIILKRLLLLILKPIFAAENAFTRGVEGLFYEYDSEDCCWYLKEQFGQMRSFFCAMYYILAAIALGLLIGTARLFANGVLTAVFYPVFVIIIVGELYFVLDGLLKQEVKSDPSYEEDQYHTARDYSLLRKVLRKLFPDKLNAENTTVDDGSVEFGTNEELVAELEQSDDFRAQVYGAFLRKKLTEGIELDKNYVASGLQLLNGQSVLFNNPFYNDLLPFIFFPMNRTLLDQGKALVVLGRHGMEEEAKQWCTDGIRTVTNIPSMWNIGVLTNEPQDLHIGILTRSAVNDMKLHEANKDFFKDVEFVILMEPSRLATTAQIGLNSIVRACREGGKRPPVFCSMDKNCDGLVDSLSHVLMTNIREVAATEHHTGINSYMCWEVNDEPMQHRMLPNISRYLGFGTELSFAALRQQIPMATWYGGDAFPVTDMHWIARQYYYDLLRYANLPTSQETIDEVFSVSPQMWSAPAAANGYITVEDESYNMFEVKRAFATRAKEQGFVNVLSTQYLLRDYMSANDGIFSADPKAIPYIAADNDRTDRNVALRLCLRMSAGEVTEREIRRELLMLDADSDEVLTALWHMICVSCGDTRVPPTDEKGGELLCCGEETFAKQVISVRKKYSVEINLSENMYSITDRAFVSALLGDLQNAEYIAEEENGTVQYLGSELMGQVFQKYLPGQFFTFNGKFYEMLRVSSNGQVIVRRAADHIHGRPAYRQERRYFISDAQNSEVMGECRNYGAYSVTKQYADIRVQTPAYWDLPEYNDFEAGKRIEINGIPERRYVRKQLLRVDLPEDLAPDTVKTLCLLFNEVLRSMFAENQDYLAVVTPAGTELPMSYSVEGENGCELSGNCFYVIEDSRLDIGLLVAVQRNLKRIFSVIYDYILWHGEALEKSLHPEPEQEPADYTVPEEEQEKPKKKGFFAAIGRFFVKVFGAIGRFFKKIFGAIGRFFKKIFGKKTKPEADPQPETPEQEFSPEPGQETEIGQETEAGQAAEPENGGEADGTSDTPEETAPDGAPDDDVNEKPHFSTNAAFFDSTPEEETPGAELEFEPDDAKKVGEPIARKPYHERFYLLYGAAQMPQWLSLDAVSELLTQLGCADNQLTQARKNKDAAAFVEKNFVPGRAGVHYCDFCGCELTGMEYDVLSDGRERCVRCGKTAVRSADEFKNIYKLVSRNMDVFFNVRITKPVQIKMVNSKRLHKALGQTFVPSGEFNGRVLGVALRGKSGYSILMENGAPALMSTMTMVHELTHIWQYLNWDENAILRKYGKEQNLEIYEGMAKWVEIQYAYLINEPATAKREELITCYRDDEYGRGFVKYRSRYPLSTGGAQGQATPFDDPAVPL